ncbi:response regulator [Candidatus Methylomirabilis sp.]|uniref:response regulator n=1 Tax=Candidatus Methylomirabilis sp. TaxID=2032687 RepID=UPI002A5EADA5|nr:response regulator [Candidatus Methylomirabilis sp.]
MHIMLCSNNVELVDAASRAFSKDGCRLTVCECGLEALGVVEVMDADLLILDLDTPGLDGLLIVAAVKELAPTLPIVAVSTKPQVDARVVSHKGVSYATLPSGSAGAMQVLLTGLLETERTRFPSGAGSAQ